MTTAPDLWPHVAYRCVVGSRAYGLSTAGSDTDRRGFFVPPADRHWSLAGVPEQIDRGTDDESYWEVEKFVRLALRSNPTALDCLYTPLVEHATPVALDLRSIRGAFPSKLAHAAYQGYVARQFKKFGSDRRAGGEPRPKRVMHLLRLLIAGVGLLETGELTLHVGEHRDRLLAVRRGEVPYADCDRWRLDLHERLDATLATTPLPDRPDVDAANAFLIRARRSAL